MKSTRVAYVVKRYPRYSETFIVNEILAHEAAGLQLEIVAIRPCTDTHFQDRIARVKAPLTVLPSGSVKGETLWALMHQVAAIYPPMWEVLAASADASPCDIYQAMLLARMVQERKITHLHAHFATDSTTVARLASLISGAPYSFTAHAKDIYHESVNPEDLRQKLREAAAVITVSDFNLRHLQQEFGQDADRVQRIYNGLDLETFTFQTPSEGSRQIIAVGRLVEKKGFGILIDACQQLRQKGVSFQCLIIGQGEEESMLRTKIHSHGLQNMVTLAGPRPQAEVIQAIRESAVMAAPCIIGEDGNRDGMPTVLLESMALGTPCVATDVTGIPEAIENRVHGLIVPQHDAAQLAVALQDVLENFGLRQSLAASARKRVEDCFSVANSTAHLRKIFLDARGLQSLELLDSYRSSSPEFAEIG
jgi:colanic acid/amylovoran biosynthesis glycosyltransferase